MIRPISGHLTHKGQALKAPSADAAHPCHMERDGSSLRTARPPPPPPRPGTGRAAGRTACPCVLTSLPAELSASQGHRHGVRGPHRQASHRLLPWADPAQPCPQPAQRPPQASGETEAVWGTHTLRHTRTRAHTPAEGSADRQKALWEEGQQHLGADDGRKRSHMAHLQGAGGWAPTASCLYLRAGPSQLPLRQGWVPESRGDTGRKRGEDSAGTGRARAPEGDPVGPGAV